MSRYEKWRTERKAVKLHNYTKKNQTKADRSYLFTAVDTIVDAGTYGKTFVCVCVCVCVS